MTELTRRETDIIELKMMGLTTAQVGAKLGIAAATVRTMDQRILVKLGAHNVAEAVAIYLGHHAGTRYSEPAEPPSR